MPKQVVVNKALAQRVLEIVDQGLSNGLGKPIPGQMCVEAAVCFAMGQPHGDEPSCVSRAVRALKIQLNDSAGWSNKKTRAKGMRRLAIAQLGSAGVVDDKEFVRRVAMYAVNVTAPAALRAAASIQKDTHQKAALEDAALKCEKAENLDAAYAASYAASDAASYAASDAASYAAYAARAASDAASDAARAASDRALGEFAEGVVQILIALQSPGCKFLSLTE